MSTFTSADVKSLNSILANADLDDLRLMGDLMKQRRDLIGRLNMGTVTRGQRVKFKGRRGVYLTGTVEKVNRKKVVVKTDTGLWNVPGTMLEKV
jgi:hypothetical protein